MGWRPRPILPATILLLAAATSNLAEGFSWHPTCTVTMSSAQPSSFPSSSTQFKILVLHGKGDTQENFSKGLGPLQQGMSKTPAGADIKWDFLTAPHEIAPGRFAWWTLPPGVRSFEAEEYTGIDQSFKVIQEVWERDGPYDAILGHSQGAIILSAILAKAVCEAFPVKPRLSVLCGAAWPKPFEGLVERMGQELSKEGQGYRPLTLHCFSPQDSINPPEQAERIMGMCGGGAKKHVHGGGHTVMQDETAIGAYSEFFFGS